MAEAVHDLPRLPSVRRIPTPSPELAYAIRFGVAVTAAIWIGKAPGLVESHSSWILITVLMLVQPTTGASLLKAVLRAAGTLAAAFTAILLFGLFAQNPSLLVAGLFLVQAVGAYGFSGTRFQYAWFVFAFTTAIVLGDALAGSTAVEVVAFERASMVGIGVLLAFVVDSLFWPARAESLLRKALAGRARLLGGSLRRALAAFTDLDAGESGGSAASQAESAPLANQLGLANAARSELGASPARLDALSHLVMLLQTLASRERVLAAPIDLPNELRTDGQSFAAALRELARQVDAALEEIAAALNASRAPAAFSSDLEQALLAVEGETDRIAPSVGWSAALAGRMADLRDVVALLATLEATLSLRRDSTTAQKSRSLGRFAPDPFRMKLALRTGVAVVAALLLPMVLGWPTNTLVAPMAFMMAAQTRGAAVQTVTSLAASLALAWVAADLVIIYVAPHLDRAPLAMLVPLALAALFAYVGSKRPLLAPLAPIGGLVVFLSVYGGMGGPTDVYGPYNIVCYISLALAIGMLFGRLMWPATAAGIFQQRVSALLALCPGVVGRVQAQSETERGRHLADLIQSYAMQATQLGPLHAQANLEPVEHALDASRRAQILTLTTDLIDAVASYRPMTMKQLSDVGGPRLQGLIDALQREDEALKDSMQSAIGVMRSEAEYRESGLAAAHRAIESCLDELRAHLEMLPEFSDGEKRRLLVNIDSRRRLVFRQRAVEQWLAEWHEAQTVRP